MTNYPDRDELARELFIKDNARQSREESLEDWAELTEPGRDLYTHHLADAALELFKAANPKPKKAKGGKIMGGLGPSPAGNIQVMLSPGGPGVPFDAPLGGAVHLGTFNATSDQIAAKLTQRNYLR